MDETFGETAIVTGAGSGMGRAIAKLFAKEGARVVAFDMNEDSVQAVVEEMKTGGMSSASLVTSRISQISTDSSIQRKKRSGRSTFSSIMRASWTT